MITSEQFNQGLPFNYTGNFQTLKSFSDGGVIIKKQAIELMKLIGRPELMNIKTEELWEIVEEGMFTPIIKMVPQPAEACFKLRNKRYGIVTILLSECTLITPNNETTN